MITTRSKSTMCYFFNLFVHGYDIPTQKNDLVCLDNQKITTFSPGFRVELVKKKGAFRPFCNIFYQNLKKK